MARERWVVLIPTAHVYELQSPELSHHNNSKVLPIIGCYKLNSYLHKSSTQAQDISKNNNNYGTKYLNKLYFNTMSSCVVGMFLILKTFCSVYIKQLETCVMGVCYSSVSCWFRPPSPECAACMAAWLFWGLLICWLPQWRNKVCLHINLRAQTKLNLCTLKVFQYVFTIKLLNWLKCMHFIISFILVVLLCLIWWICKIGRKMSHVDLTGLYLKSYNFS